MTNPADVESAPADSAALSAPRRDIKDRYREWKPRFRWFLAEFLVVLSGVLVALAVNSWWEKRQADERLHEYLRGVIVELVATEAELSSEIEASAALLADAQRVHNAFFSSGTLSIDSVKSWWTFDHSDPEPMLGTLRALVETGDINLVRDDSVRHALVWLGERGKYYDARLRKWEQSIVGTFDRLYPLQFALEALEWDRQGRPSELQAWDGHGVWSETVRTLPVSLQRPHFATTLEAVLNDRQTYEAAVLYLVSTHAHLSNQRRLLADVTLARGKIESAVRQ